MRLAFATMAIALLGCVSCLKLPSSADGGDQVTGAGACKAYAHAVRSGEVPPELLELSGLAASARHEGIFWAVNDSGQGFDIMAITEAGEVRARYTFPGLPPAFDPESLAVGRCASGSSATCLFVGDVGDNLARRTSVAIYRAPEPAVIAPGTLDGAERFEFTYPDGPRDAEAMVADPKTGRLYVVSKSPYTLGDIYEVTLGAGRSIAVKVATVRAPSEVDRLTTAADVHPSGERVLLRTYGLLWELYRPGATSLEQVFSVEPVRLPAPQQRQSEAVAYSADGKSYLLGTEGAGQPLYRVDCVDSAKVAVP